MRIPCRRLYPCKPIFQTLRDFLAEADHRVRPRIVPVRVDGRTRPNRETHLKYVPLLFTIKAGEPPTEKGYQMGVAAVCTVAPCV